VKITLTVDGAPRETVIDPGESLMDVLRREGKTSVKNGCDRGDCGSCAVLVDGRAVNACLVFAAQIDGAEIRTVEGLAGPGGLHPLQFTALDAGAVQCGFCTPGMLMTSYAFLQENPSPTPEEIRVGIAGNICRCTGYQNIVKAIGAAAAKMNKVEIG